MSSASLLSVPSPTAVGAVSRSVSPTATPPSISPAVSPASSTSSSPLSPPHPPPMDGAGHLKTVAFSLYPPSSTSSTPAHLLDRPSTGLSSTSSTDAENEVNVVDSPLSVDASTCCSSAASSRAPSPSLHPVPPHTSPTHRLKPQTALVPPPLALHSPAVSPVVQPLSPGSPSASSEDLSSTSSSSSSSSFTYGKEASGRGERLRQRGKRVPLSQTQKAVLEESFLSNHYPTREEKTQLGQRINLTGDKVHKWYDNRRTKLNKEGKGKRGGVDMFMSHGLYDEASGSLRLHPYSSLSLKPRSSMLGVAAPILPLQPQQLQLQQLQQQQQMQSAQLQQLQLLQNSNLQQHPFLHTNPQLYSSHQQAQQAQQLQQHQQQQQVQHENLLRQMSLNAMDPRLSLLSPSQLNFLQSASVSPALQMGQHMPASTPSMAGLSVLMPKPTTPPGANSSAFHAVGQSSANSPVVLTRGNGGLSALALSSPSVPASPHMSDVSASSLSTPRHPTQLPSLAFRSLSAQDVPSFNAAFAHQTPGSFPSMSSDHGGLTSPPGASPLFTCTPTATGFSLYRPFPNTQLK